MGVLADACGHVRADTLAWSIIEGAGRVTPSGTFTAPTAPGTTLIRAALGELALDIEVVTLPGAVDHVTIDGPIAMSPPGELTLSATVYDAFGNDTGVEASWSLSSAPAGLSLTTTGVLRATCDADIDGYVGLIVAQAASIPGPRKPRR